MKATVTEYEFVDRIMRIRPNNFSRAGLFALFGHITEWEGISEIEMEFDPIGLCCEFTEYENLKEFHESYSDEYATLEDIREETTVIQIDDEAFIIQDF